MPTLEKRGKYYSFRYCYGGRQFRQNTGETDRLKAKLFMEDFLHNKKHSKNKITGGYDIEHLFWEDFKKLYMSYSRSVKIEPSTDITVINKIDEIIKPKYLKDLSEASIRRFMDYRKHIDKIKDSSINRQLHVIKSMWSFAIKHLRIDYPHQAQLIKDIPVPIVQKIAFFTLDQCNIILSKSKPLHVQILSWLMMSFALRLKEAVNVKWEDINFRTNRLLIHPFKTKNSNPELVSLYMPSTFVKFVSKLKRTSIYVCGADFTSKQGLNGLSKQIQNEYKRLVGFGSAHICRHTWITHAKNNPNIKQSDIMEYARVSDPKILKAYGHYTVEREQSIANAVYQPVSASGLTVAEIDRRIAELVALKKTLV
jgi:integrase